MPRVIAFVNGSLGAQALGLLAPHLVGVVVHAPERQRAADELARAIPSGIPVWQQVDGNALAACRPTHGVSVLYGEILRQPVINLFPHGIANLHPSYLPYGRGAHPNAWALVTGEPAGVTLHLIDSGVDTGPILAQSAVAVHVTDDAKAVYGRLMDAASSLLHDALPQWLAGALVPWPQPIVADAAATRRVRDLDRLLCVDPDATYTGRQLIDLLRARTFADYPGAPYVVDGHRLRLRLVIEEET